ncbi:hypothetical protein B0H19DRAFT_1249538 [Mycena capillaripes]|nr:hypothetical protein B0H19DRAFT_1249538 [Mycena capillaripes]
MPYALDSLLFCEALDDNESMELGILGLGDFNAIRRTRSERAGSIAEMRQDDPGFDGHALTPHQAAAEAAWMNPNVVPYHQLFAALQKRRGKAAIGLQRPRTAHPTPSCADFLAYIETLPPIDFEMRSSLLNRQWYDWSSEKLVPIFAPSRCTWNQFYEIDLPESERISVKWF